MQFAFRRRYSLPPTDPRFLDATDEEIVLDYWAHRLWDNPKVREEAYNPDFEADLAAMDAEDGEGDGWETVADDAFGAGPEAKSS